MSDEFFLRSASCPGLVVGLLAPPAHWRNRKEQAVFGPHLPKTVFRQVAMSLRFFLLFVMAFVCLSTGGKARTSMDPNEGSQLSQDSTTGVYTFSWSGRAGRTYFIQQSDDLTNWSYLPVIESGEDQVIQWGVTSSAPAFFVRLKYTDISTADPFNDDFDGDGVSNWNELLQGTDPLAAVFDANGLPLDWEQFYGIAPGTDPNAASPRGDGLTYLQAFQQGLNPNSSAGEQSPVLYVVGGYNQAGPPGSVLPTPVSVQVFAPKKYTAPVTFTVSAGTALLTADSRGNNPTGTVTVQPTTPWVNQNGATVYVAQVYVYLPAASDRISTIAVTAPSGAQTTSASTQVFAYDPNVSAPGGFGVNRVDATTADLSWTPADPTLPTDVEVSYDYGSTWSGLTSFDPGTTGGTIYHLTPDQQVSLRIYTGSSGGGGSSGTDAMTTAGGTGGGSGSAPSDPTTFTPLSVPTVSGYHALIDACNYTFPGFQTPSNRYLQIREKTSVPDFDPANPFYSFVTYEFDDTWINTYSMQEYHLWWEGIPIYTRSYAP